MRLTVGAARRLPHRGLVRGEGDLIDVIPSPAMSIVARQRWFATMMESGLTQQIFGPADVLRHATPEVLATNLPPELLSKVLAASLAAGAMTPERVLETVTPDGELAYQRSELARVLKQWRKALAPDATVWVSWPKKASKVPTDISEDTVREVALPLGFVDVKVCAIDAVWSGLKLVVRKELR